MKPGDSIGKFQVLSRIARGGMAEVWLARAQGVGGFEKELVLKTILPHLSEDPDFIHMFINEALLAARLNHPNVVQIFDLGCADGMYFIAMEHIPGRSLRQIARRVRQDGELLPVWFLLRVVVAACDGLQYAHDYRSAEGRPLNVVHRDISPENIMVSFTGTVKLLDFGIAKATTVASITHAGTLKGKYSYISPEQVRGQLATAKSDIYAMGVVLYELLAGVRPFTGANDIELLRSVVDAQPMPLGEVAPWVPADLQQVVARAMAKDPAQRQADASELGGELLTHLHANYPIHRQRDLALYLGSLFPGEPSIPSDVVRSLEHLSKNALPGISPRRTVEAEGSPEAVVDDDGVIEAEPPDLDEPHQTARSLVDLFAPTGKPTAAGTDDPDGSTVPYAEPPSEISAAQRKHVPTAPGQGPVPVVEAAKPAPPASKAPPASLAALAKSLVGAGSAGEPGKSKPKKPAPVQLARPRTAPRRPTAEQAPARPQPEAPAAAAAAATAVSAAPPSPAVAAAATPAAAPASETSPPAPVAVGPATSPAPAASATPAAPADRRSAVTLARPTTRPRPSTAPTRAVPPVAAPPPPSTPAKVEPARAEAPAKLEKPARAEAPAKLEKPAKAEAPARAEKGPKGVSLPKPKPRAPKGGRPAGPAPTSQDDQPSRPEATRAEPDLRSPPGIPTGTGASPARAPNIFSVKRPVAAEDDSDVFTSFRAARLSEEPAVEAPRAAAAAVSEVNRAARAWLDREAGERTSIFDQLRPAAPAEPPRSTGSKEAPRRGAGAAIAATKHFEKGLASLRQGRYQEAFAEWSTAVELDPENKVYQSNLKRLKKRLESPG